MEINSIATIPHTLSVLLRHCELAQTSEYTARGECLGTERGMTQLFQRTQEKSRGRTSSVLSGGQDRDSGRRQGLSGAERAWPWVRGSWVMGRAGAEVAQLGWGQTAKS